MAELLVELRVAPTFRTMSLIAVQELSIVVVDTGAVSEYELL